MTDFKKQQPHKTHWGVYVFFAVILVAPGLILTYLMLSVASSYAPYKTIDRDLYLRNTSSSEMNAVVLMRVSNPEYTTKPKSSAYVYRLFGPFRLASFESVLLGHATIGGPAIECVYQMKDGTAGVGDLKLLDERTLSRTEKKYLPDNLWSTLTESVEYSIDGTVENCTMEFADYRYDQWREYQYH